MTDGQLFHATDLSGAAESLAGNRLPALRTATLFGGERARGVALTRSRALAGQLAPAVFALDERRLSRVHRIEAVRLFDARPSCDGEVFVVGAILELRRFLSAVEVDEDAGRAMDGAGLAPLRSHPLMRVRGAEHGEPGRAASLTQP